MDCLDRGLAALFSVMLLACGTAPDELGEEAFVKRTVKAGCTFDRDCDSDAFEYGSISECVEDRFSQARVENWCDDDFVRSEAPACLGRLVENARTCGDAYDQWRQPECEAVCSTGMVFVDQYGPAVYYDGS